MKAFSPVGFMRFGQFGRAAGTASLFASIACLSGCGADNGETNLGGLSEASVRTPQTPLDGNAIPKFVDQLPTFNGRRQNGSVTLNVNMQEFQSRVLPASVYASLPAPFNNGTFLWGYNINNAG